METTFAILLRAARFGGQEASSFAKASEDKSAVRMWKPPSPSSFAQRASEDKSAVRMLPIAKTNTNVWSRLRRRGNGLA